MGNYDTTLLREWSLRRSEDAFRTLVERHAPLVHGTALRLLRRSDWAAEAAQDAFVLLARKAARVNGATLAGWLHRTVTFTSRALLKKESRHGSRAARWAAEAQEPPAFDPGEAASDAGALDAALDSLTECDRALLIARYFHDHSAAEAAAAFGWSPAAAQKRTERALRRLARSLGRREPRAAVAALAAAAAAQAQHRVAAAAFVRATRGNAFASCAVAGGGASLFLHSLVTMKATHAAALTAVLALIPVVLLSVRNHQLRTASERSQQPAAPAEGARRPLAASAATAIAAADHPAGPARAEAARAVNWDALGDDAKVTVELSRDTILRSELPVLANYSKFTLSDGVRELLRISDAEAEAVESALRDCESSLKTIERSKIRRVEDLPNGVVFEIPAFAAEGRPLREALFARVTDAVGERRAAFLLPKIAQATDWRLARFGAMKRTYRVEFQQDQPVIEADGSRRSTELLTTRVDFERGDSLDHSEIMEHDGPILAPVATRTKGVHVLIGEFGDENSVALSPELAHLFTIEELRR